MIENTRAHSIQILLVPPCHSQQGVKFAVQGTHPGLEVLRQALLQNTTYVICTVYELDGIPLQTLRQLVSTTFFEIIGFSFLATTFKFDLEVLAALFRWSPESVFLLGGSNIGVADPAILFDAFPVDAIFTVPAPELFVQFVHEVATRGLGTLSKGNVLSRLPELEGVVLRSEYLSLRD